jgi:hypothetical protein
MTSLKRHPKYIFLRQEDDEVVKQPAAWRRLLMLTKLEPRRDDDRVGHWLFSEADYAGETLSATCAFNLIAQDLQTIATYCYRRAGFNGDFRCPLQPEEVEAVADFLKQIVAKVEIAAARGCELDASRAEIRKELSPSKGQRRV